MTAAPTPRYAAIYGRVSTEDQVKGFSIPTQLEACQKLAEHDGYTVPDSHVLIDEGISGTTMERPGLRQLRDLVQTKAIAAAIVYDPDRLSRNLGHQLLLAEEFERASVKLLIVSHPMEQGPEGWLFFQMRGALAEYERAKILERTKRGMLRRAKDGYVNGGRVPLGYRYVSEPHKGHYAIDEEEAAVVRQIFQWYVEGLPVRAIARRLTDARIPTAIDRRGLAAGEGRRPCKVEARGVWATSAVAGMLKNPVYVGRMRYNARGNVRRDGQRVAQRPRPAEEWLAVPVPAIISPELYAAVQARRQENQQHRPPRQSTVLLGGRWFKCGRCGNAMSGVSSNGHRYYRCGSSHVRMALERRCGGSIRADKAEAHVWEAVMRVLEQPDVVAAEVAKRQASLDEQDATIAEELAGVKSRLARCDEEDRRLIDAYMAGAFTAAELKAYRVNVQTKRESLESHHQEIIERREALQGQTAQMASLVDYCRLVRYGLQTFSREEQHRTFDALALRVTWLPKEPLRLEMSFVESSTSASRSAIPRMSRRYSKRRRWVGSTNLGAQPAWPG
jgi:site-specific DNA recombinase